MCVRICVCVYTGDVSTIAGGSFGSASDGYGTSAYFRQPQYVAISPDQTLAVVTEETNGKVRQIDLATSAVTTLAGPTFGMSDGCPDYGACYTDGVGTNAKFDEPLGVVFSPDGLFVYIADSGNKRIRKIEVFSQPVTCH